MLTLLLKIHHLLTPYFLIFGGKTYLWKEHGEGFCPSSGFLPVCDYVHLSIMSSHHFICVYLMCVI